jgi:hypothetical protein
VLKKIYSYIHNKNFIKDYKKCKFICILSTSNKFEALLESAFYEKLFKNAINILYQLVYEAMTHIQICKIIEYIIIIRKLELNNDKVFSNYIQIFVKEYLITPTAKKNEN